MENLPPNFKQYQQQIRNEKEEKARFEQQAKERETAREQDEESSR